MTEDQPIREHLRHDGGWWRIPWRHATAILWLVAFGDRKAFENGVFEHQPLIRAAFQVQPIRIEKFRDEFKWF